MLHVSPACLRELKGEDVDVLVVAVLNSSRLVVLLLLPPSVSSTHGKLTRSRYSHELTYYLGVDLSDIEHCRWR